MSRAPAEKITKKDNPGKNTRAKSREEEAEQQGWRYVFVWIIPLTICFLLTAISIIWASHKWLAIHYCY